MSNPVAGIDIVARLDRFRQDLALIPGIGSKEAKALAAEMAKEIRKAEAAAKAAGIAANASRKQLVGFGDAAGRVGQNATKMTGALGLISPAAQQVSAGIGDLADVMEVVPEVAEALGVSVHGVVTAMATAATTAALLYVAWQAYTEEGDRAQATTDRLSEAHKKLEPLLNANRDATIRLRVATGGLTEEEGRAALAASRMADEYMSSTADTRKELEALHETQGSVKQGFIDAAEGLLWWTPLGAAVGALTTSTEEMLPLIDGLTQSLAAQNEAGRESLEIATKTAAADAKNKAALDAKSATTRAAADAARDLAEAERLAADAAAIEEARVERVVGAMEAMETASRKAVVSQLSDVDRIRAARDQDLANLLADYEIGIAAAEQANRAHIGLDEAYAAAQLEISFAAKQDMIRAAEKADAAILRSAEERAARERDLLEQQWAAHNDSAGALGDLAGMLGDDLAEHGKKGAYAAYAVQKAAALAQATINTALAISAANALPPPANVPAMISAGLVGAAQYAAILSVPPPSFQDTPQMMQARGGAGGRATVGLADGDVFAAARTPEDLRRQVGGGDRVVVLQIGRMGVEEMLRTSERGNGRLNSVARKAARRNGHGAGRSGGGSYA